MVQNVLVVALLHLKYASSYVGFKRNVLDYHTYENSVDVIQTITEIFLRMEAN